MNINIRRLSDRIREPFLFLDYLFWLIFDFSKFNKIKKGNVKSSVFVHTGAIGEVIYMIPLIKAIKKEYNCKTSCVLSRGKEGIFKGNPFVDEIILDKGLSSKDKINSIKIKNFDLAIIFQASFKNGYNYWKAGTKYRIGGFSRIKRFPTLFYTKRLFPIGNFHAFDWCLKILELLNINTRGIYPEIYFEKNEEFNIINKLKLKNTKYILINPGYGANKKNSGPPRFWSYNKYGKLIDYISNNYRAKIVLSGTEDQELMVKKIMSFVKEKRNIINISGKTNLRELILVIKNAELVIAPDTGASHIAAITKKPLINFMDAPPHNWAPVGDKDKIINLYKPREFFIFEDGKIMGYRGGVKEIKFEEVKKSVQKLLNSKLRKKNEKTI